MNEKVGSQEGVVTLIYSIEAITTIYKNARSLGPIKKGDTGISPSNNRKMSIGVFHFDSNVMKKYNLLKALTQWVLVVELVLRMIIQFNQLS